jgi:hypothetical protein
MNSQTFNNKFIPQLKTAIQEFIKQAFENEEMVFIRVRDLDDDNDRDQEIIDSAKDYLFNSDQDFADYFHSNYQVQTDMYLEMIIYCNKYMNDNFGENEILDWKRFNDREYITSMTAYVYVCENRDEFIQNLNDNKNNYQVNTLK